MKMFTWIIGLLVIIQGLNGESTLSKKFQLQVGEQQTIQLGESITLDGKVSFGDKNKIEKYHWEEEGKILLNNYGDEIVYWDMENSENGWTAKNSGVHLLKFVVTMLDGQKIDKVLRIKVEKEPNNTNSIKFDFKVSYFGDEAIVYMKTGETVALSAVIEEKDGVDFYRWEENGEVLSNKLGDKILYWDEKNRENDYVPMTSGDHHLDFIVTKKSGQEVKRELLLTVSPSADTIIEAKDLIFDINDRFPVKREQRPPSYQLARGHYIDVNVGDIIPLSGIVNASKKHLVDFYRWELNGTVIHNQENDEIKYWNEENRENDYLAKASGKEFLNFIVTDVNGNETSKTLLLKINDQSKDDHGNDISSASTIALNKVINAKFETQDDHDFFKFQIDQRQYVQVVFTKRGGPRPVQIFSEDGTKMDIKYLSVPASGGLVRMYQTLFEVGTYYVDVSDNLGDYSLEVKTDKIEEDKVGESESEATKITLGTETVGYINAKDDVDYFYIIAPKKGILKVENIEDNYSPTRLNGNSSLISFKVNEGEKYYIKLSHRNSKSSSYLTQFKYSLRLYLN